MAEALTPEEARKTADDMDWSVAAFEASDQEACHIFYDRDVAEVAATLCAYADQAERLSAYEGAVPAAVSALNTALSEMRDLHSDHPSFKEVFEAWERLRALQEK